MKIEPKQKACHVQRDLRNLANHGHAGLLQRFFKTGPGEYGEGDVFLGLKVPQVRNVVKVYASLSLVEVQKLLNSKIHEDRFAGIQILVSQMKQAQTDAEQARIYRFYVKNLPRVNNWDLVDSSSPQIVGRYLVGRDRKILYKWAQNKNLWPRRIAIISCFTFIRLRDFDDALRIATILLQDREDLIHKAVGWMLREIGKLDRTAEEKFLIKHHRTMPRTMLRYAIEHFPDRKRRAYLWGRA